MMTKKSLGDEKDRLQARKNMGRNVFSNFKLHCLLNFIALASVLEARRHLSYFEVDFVYLHSPYDVPWCLAGRIAFPGCGSIFCKVAGWVGPMMFPGVSQDEYCFPRRRVEGLATRSYNVPWCLAGFGCKLVSPGFLQELLSILQLLLLQQLFRCIPRKFLAVAKTIPWA